MTRKLLVLALIAPFCSGMAMAQTTDNSTASSSSEEFGGDWSRTLGSAIFSDPEMTKMRSSNEIASQWATMSAEDKAMLKRDCATHVTRTGDATGTTTGDASSGSSDAGTSTDTTASSGTSGDDTTMAQIRVNATQMTELCNAIKTLN